MNVPSRGICAASLIRKSPGLVAGNSVVILREVTDQRDRDEVQHDRVDDFVRTNTPSALRESRPTTRDQDRGEHRIRNGDERFANLIPPRRRKRGDVELTFRADVE